MVEHLLSRLDTLIPLVCAMSVMEMKSDIGPPYSDVSSLVLFVLFILYPPDHGYIETDVSFSNSDVLLYSCCMKLPTTSSASDDELSSLVSEKMRSATIKMTKKTVLLLHFFAVVAWWDGFTTDLQYFCQEHGIL